MSKKVLIDLLTEFQKKAGEQAFLKTFEINTNSFDVNENQKILAKSFSESMGASAGDLFDIIDKMIDLKLSTATVTPILVAPSGGGTVTGKITIKGN